MVAQPGSPRVRCAIKPRSAREFNSWLQVVNTKEEKISTTNNLTKLNQALTAFCIEIGSAGDFYVIAGKHWSAVITYRKSNVRLISVRRARTEEVALYES